MIWVVDLSASYLELFELLREEMPTETAIMRVSRQETSFHFNPFLLGDPRKAAELTLAIAHYNSTVRFLEALQVDVETDESQS